MQWGRRYQEEELQSLREELRRVSREVETETTQLREREEVIRGIREEQRQVTGRIQKTCGLRRVVVSLSESADSNGVMSTYLIAPCPHRTYIVRRWISITYALYAKLRRLLPTTGQRIKAYTQVHGRRHIRDRTLSMLTSCRFYLSPHLSLSLFLRTG